jgi:hypothetical protein
MISAPKKLQTAVDKSTAQQQAAIDHYAIAADRGNGRPIEAHNLGFGIRKAELAAYGAVDDPERPDLSCTIEVHRASRYTPPGFSIRLREHMLPHHGQGPESAQSQLLDDCLPLARRGVCGRMSIASPSMRPPIISVPPVSAAQILAKSPYVIPLSDAGPK